MNVLALNTARDDDPNGPRYHELLLDKESNHRRYQPLDPPSLYSRGVPLRAFVDTPMHLILLGVGRTVFKRVSTWSARRGRKADFVAQAKVLLQQLDDLKLKWLVFVPRTFSHKWGGWVSKNYASLTRVALWIYGPLMTIDDAPPYEDPTGDPNKWKVAKYKAWLKARGLDTNGNKPELQPRVMNFMMGDPGEIPPILPNMYGSASDMIDMVKSMVLLVTTLFQDRVEKHTQPILELRVRIFLTRFHKFDKAMRTPDQKPTWLESYNFLCLKNLPETIQEFGPCRRWFEGKWLGERYVSKVKQERSRCPPKNVASILMRNLHRSKAVDMLVPPLKTSSVAELIGVNTRIFGSLTEIDEQFHTHLPLPVVILNNGGLACLYYKIGRNIGSEISVRKLEKETEAQILHHGLNYNVYTLSDESHNLDAVHISDYGVLLPRLGEDGIGQYTIVTKNWSTEMFGEYNFALESDNYLGGLGNQPPKDGFDQDEEEGWI